MEVSQKIKNRTVIWSSNFTSGYLPKENKSIVWNDICIPMIITALFTIDKIYKQPMCPSIDKWIKKMGDISIFLYLYLYLPNRILLSHKNKRNGVICSEVDGVRVCHTEWSKSEREKQIQYANTYIWHLRGKKEKVMKNLVVRRE